MNTGDIEHRLSTQDITSSTPTDTQHPVMYERAVYIQGGITALCVIALTVLLGFAPAAAEVGVPVLGTIAGITATSVAALLTPRA